MSPPEMDTFVVMLHNLSTQLDDKELDTLKFLCQEKMGKKKLESVKSVRDLFRYLMELLHISRDNLEFLRTLLKTIKRHDLVQEVDGFQERSLGVDAMSEIQESDQFGLAFDIICENVGRNWKMLARRLGVSDVKMDHIVTANPYNMHEQLMQSLREWQKKKGREAQVSDLLRALKSCNMNLVAEKLAEGLNIRQITN
ncbi:hypothetical protein FKM82_003414 [Ascaphus truei]